MEEDETDETDPGRRWDARFRAAAPGGLFGDRPNAYLKAAMAGLDTPPRTALMLADGDGRNGTWLACEAVAVTAIDASAEATAQAKRRDGAAGVLVERIVADLARWRPEPGIAWEMTTLLYLQAPKAVRLRALGIAAGHLAPGGLMVVEAFAEAQAAGEIGPADPEKLYRLEDLTLAAAYAGLEVVEALEGAVLLDEGPRHAGEAQVVRLIARAPDQA